jgi:hypothetical protein
MHIIVGVPPYFLSWEVYIMLTNDINYQNYIRMIKIIYIYITLLYKKYIYYYISNIIIKDKNKYIFIYLKNYSYIILI